MSSFIKIKACFFVIAGFILVIASVFIITTCKSPIDQFNTEDIYSINTIEEFEILLRKLPANTADKPYKILLNVDDLTGVSQPIKNNYKKYINLELSSDSIKSIDKFIFGGCNNIIIITIPDSVTDIGEGAFIGCINLKNVFMTENIINIGERAFSLCSNLESIIIPSRITKINYKLFEECISLTSINLPNSVTSIGHSAFQGCTSLISVIIPDNVEQIEACAFADCPSLAAINIPNSVTSIGNSAFANCSSLNSVNIPDSVRYIGDLVFDNCKKLYAIDVDENNIEYSSIDGVLYNKDKTFLLAYPRGKINSTFVIPSCVTTIKYGAFIHCVNITSIIIPGNITSIRGYAFYYCINLTNVTFEGKIPSGDFSSESLFPGDLRDKFYADDENNGTPGTYTREADGITWIRQP